MPILKNDELNVSLEINLMKKDSMDFNIVNPDYMNWIPFNFIMLIDNEIIEYTEEALLTFSIRELKYLFKNLIQVINQVKKSFAFSSSELLFELNIINCEEDNLFEIIFWFNMGTLTNGDKYGYSKGYKFHVDLDNLTKFTFELESQFNTLLKMLSINI